ncbi:MAG: ATP-binding protein [Deltaproteobacteria bacterium]|nr:ATP-binding protein [Deltaproteobacteria bacterium]MBN2672542.1 ATP-binding protein [Deltaproteobacteria bacterium]
MDFSDFRSRAISEGKRYGKDEYVFVREFAQNARDAGASRIVVNTEYKGGELLVAFVDNGEGMSFVHAREYLFTLYASSKEEEMASAGQFGVGFWSILLFSPDRIVIHSNTTLESWGVEFNQALDGERRVAPSLSGRGTSVMAYKIIAPKAAAAAVAEIETALMRYCRFLRRNDRSASPLEVRFNGRRIDGPLTLDGECASTFEFADVQGAVALGKSPKVNLYVRGLPVWMGTSLSELQYGASPEVQVSYPQGLAPMYLLNGNKLSVTLDRRSVFDDTALQRVRRIANREMRKLVAGYLDRIAPGTWRSRLEFAFSMFVEDFGLYFLRRFIPVWITLLLITGIGAAFWLVFPDVVDHVFHGADGDEDGPLEVIAFGGRGLGSSGEYEQATTQVGEGRAVELTYRPANEAHYFRTQVAEILDTRSGARSGILTPYRIPADYRCKKNCVHIEVGLDDKPGVYHLPVPTGYYIENRSLALASGQQGELVRSVKDDWLFIQKQAPAGGGKLSYTTGRATTSVHNATALLQVPDVHLPSSYAEAVKQAEKFKRKQKQVDQLSLFVEASIAYDTSESTAAAYQRFFGASVPGNWFEFVFQLGKGDCDVKNIVLMVLLRRMGIPARLAVGYVGEDGETRAGKHAWVEYYDNGWQISDATGQEIEETQTVSATSSASSEAQTDVQPDTSADASESAPSSDHTAAATAASTPIDIQTASSVQSIVRRWWPGFATLLFLPFLVWLVVRRRKCKPMQSPSRKQETLAAQMLQAALEDKKMHLRGSGLFSRQLIPTWRENCRISMNYALSLSKRKKLFYARHYSPLVARIVSAGTPVVDVSNAAFVAVVGRLAGSVGIDELDVLSPVQITAMRDESSAASRVITEVLEISKRLGMPDNGIVPCRGDMGALFKEMDISGLPVSWKKGIPQRFIALSTTDKDAWNRLERLGGDARGAAVLVLDRMAVHCAVFRTSRNALREMLASYEQESRD